MRKKVLSALCPTAISKSIPCKKESRVGLAWVETRQRAEDAVQP